MKKVICNSVGKHDECVNCGASVFHYPDFCEPCPFIKNAKCEVFESQTEYIAFHKSTKETWGILGIFFSKNEVCVAGYPPTIAKLSDCTMFQKQNELTEKELNYRKSQFGSDWD